MKIIRHQTPSGPAYAALQADGSAVEISGDILGSYKTTGKVVTPGKILAPIVPSNILGIGLNYRRHAEEGGKGVPDRPMLFIKSTNTLQNPGDPIEIPVKNASTQVDYECELAVVIGRTCKNVSKADALSYVLGYTAANDVSSRDWQFALGGGQFCQGKSFDTFCPLGPVLVTTDEIPNPNALRIKTILNGVTMQDWSTDDMVFDVPTLVSFLSASKTLLPGTVILTGTPHGVGYARKPPVFMKAGDTVTIEIEKIGSLTNPVVEEKV
ncbi:MAG TPA: fumarylacetoacetate hydrolase family protein [Opitutaceae bacterium]|jgi:2-keto-4-pentenoate hydratase/2-oxohepta-3-ene-1,7-dioic acid hydratase in catechol pathway|nr:fumarylacetoacetate hydrolase family protein [Opitutaceae bacterium]